MLETVRRYASCVTVAAVGASVFAAPVPVPRNLNRTICQIGLLNSKRISDAHRRSWHPPELVAIIGDAQGRHWGPFGLISFSQDGKRIATKAEHECTSNVYLWEPPHIHLLSKLFINDLKHIHFIPHSDILLACGKDGQNQCWDISGRKPREITAIPAKITTSRYINFSPNKQKVLCDVASFDKRAEFGYKIIDLSSSPPTVSFIPIKAGTSMYSSAFSPDSGELATLTGTIEASRGWFTVPYRITNLQVTLWDLNNLSTKKSRTLDGQFGEWDSLLFSPDGKTLLVGDNLWDLTSNKPKIHASIRTSEEGIRDYEFNSDGSRTVWNYPKDYNCHARVSCFTPDNNYLITNSLNEGRSYLRVFDLRLPKSH